MTFIRRSITVEAPPTEVWGVFADFGGVADWHPYFESASLDDPEVPSGVGASRTCDFGPKLAIRETVREWVDDERMKIGIEFVKGMAPPIDDVEAAVEVDGGAEGPTELALTMKYQPKWGVVGTALDALLIRRQYEGVFAEMLPAAKNYAENGSAPEPIAMLGSGRKL